MKTFSRMTGAAIFSAIMTAQAPAAEIPAKYHGVYAAEEHCAELPNSENDIGEFPWMIVTKNAIQGHETLCEVLAVRPNAKGSADQLTLACSADGDEKPTKVTETWSLQRETKPIWGFQISQPYLSRGEIRLKKCALQVLPRRN